MWKRGKRAAQDREKKRSIAAGYAKGDQTPRKIEATPKLTLDESVQAPAPVIQRMSDPYHRHDYGSRFPGFEVAPSLNMPKRGDKDDGIKAPARQLRRANTFASHLEANRPSDEQRRAISLDRIQSHAKLRELNRTVSETRSVHEKPVQRGAAGRKRRPYGVSWEPSSRALNLHGATLDVIKPQVVSADEAHYIAVEIGCSLLAPATQYGLRPLDIAVVIDTSVYSSAGAVMSCYDTVMHVMAFLESSLDRLAILRTNNLNNDMLEDYLVLGLGGVDSRRIRAAIDSVSTCQEKPDADYLNRSVKAAQILLLLSLQKTEDSERHLQPSKHVLVLTNNPAALGQDICGEDHVQVHVLCPQATVMHGFQSSYNNGWFLMNRDVVCQPENNGDESKSFRQSIGSLISCARSGIAPSVLTNVSVTLNTNKNCSVKAIVGSTSLAQLHPGEVTTLLIKVKTPLNEDDKPGLHGFPRGLRTPSGLVDLEKELDAMLTEHLDPSMMVKVTYTHPALPKSTTCSFIGHFALSTSTPLPVCQPESIPRQPSPFSTDARVQRRQVHHIATHKPPKHAINILQTYLGYDGSRSACQEFVRAAIGELKHRARVFERFDLAVDSTDLLPSASAVWGSTSNRSVATFSVTSTVTPRPSPRKITAPHAQAQSHSPVTPTRPAPLRVATRAPSNETIDHARRIWIELRRKTKGNIRPHDDSPDFDDQKKKIREKAVSNRRSVGQDTLISMTAGARKENVAPWL